MLTDLMYFYFSSSDPAAAAISQTPGYLIFSSCMCICSLGRPSCHHHGPDPGPS